MSEQAEQQQQQQEIVQLWRDWLTESERQFNAFFNELMGSESFARSVGGYMEAFVMFQRTLADGMERYLSMMNMPSRNDVIALGETLRSMEARLASIEEMFRIAMEVGTGDSWSDSSREPARTRRPAGVLAADEVREEEGIPEELRR